MFVTNLLNMKLLSALPRLYEAEVRAMRVDASKGTLDRDHLKRVMSDRQQHLERVKKKPRHQKDEDEAYITQGSSGGGRGKKRARVQGIDVDIVTMQTTVQLQPK